MIGTAQNTDVETPETEMAKVQKVAFSPTYLKVAAETQARNEANDCSVKAIVILCGVSYDVAHAALKARGRQDRAGCSSPIIWQAMTDLGFKVKLWDCLDIQDKIAEYPGRGKNLKSVTTHHFRRFPKAWAGCHPNLAVFVKGHILAVKNGEVCDWSVNNSRPVTNIWEVTKA